MASAILERCHRAIRCYLIKRYSKHGKLNCFGNHGAPRALWYSDVFWRTSAPRLNSTLLSMQPGKALLLSPSETSSEKSRILLGCVLEYALSTWIQFIGLRMFGYVRIKFQFAPCPVTTCSHVNFWGLHQHVALRRRDFILAIQPGVRCKTR